MKRTCRVCDRLYDPDKVRQGVPQGICTRACALDAKRLRATDRASRRRVPPRPPRALFGGPSSRDWTQALAKRDGAACRVCGNLPVDAAHIVPRSVAPNAGETEDSIVPLCREHHRQYDAGQLDVLPYLTLPEQAHAVVAAGGIVGALRITTGKRDVA